MTWCPMVSFHAAIITEYSSLLLVTYTSHPRLRNRDNGKIDQPINALRIDYGKTSLTPPQTGNASAWIRCDGTTLAALESSSAWP